MKWIDTWQHIKKQRHCFANKGPYSQSYGFSSNHVCMWELEHREDCWALKNWYFRIVLMEKTLESSWTARRSNQSILKEIRPEYSLEGLMLKLKLQYFGHLLWRADSLGKALMLERIEGKSRRGRQMRRWLDVITDSMDLSSSKPWEMVKDRESWHAAIHVSTKCWTPLSNRTTIYMLIQNF